MRRHLRPVSLIAIVAAAAAALALVSAEPKALTTNPGSRIVHLGDLVRVPRQPLKQCKDLVDPDKGAAALHLLVDGLDTGIQGLKCDDDLEPAVTFEFRRVRSNAAPAAAEAAAWDTVLGHPLESLGGTRQLNVDIGRPQDAGSAHIAVVGATLTLAIFRWWAPAAAIAVLFVWGLMIYLGAQSTLVRDPAPAGTALERRTFSLARTQFAWWFAIVFGSLGFLWLVTGEVPALSSQALALVGIAGATTGLAGAVAPGRTISNGQEGVFFHDLLSDVDGVAIHRLQMVVVTIALGLVFLYEVGTRLTMPTFDWSLLAMMGLSSVAYVGLKIPEAAAATPAVDPKAGYAPAPSSALPPVIRPQ
jgi:hypothetical protein